MYHAVEQRLSRMINADRGDAIRGGLTGLEKESLRVSLQGTIAQTPHPRVLGSALTHPYITTDYSEALLEFITPPLQERRAVLGFLQDTQKFVYDRLGDEILWATSMPCVLEGGAAIPIAQYGRSNAGLMKTVYRRGLGHRYGRSMQVIAGVHFNYSLPDAFWPLFRELEESNSPLKDFVAEAYIGMIRNLQRWGWLIPFFFGASPAVCKSFLGGRGSDLMAFDRSTYFYPYATSLRMGDIGYQNSLEEGRGFKANYDSLNAYVRSLTWAIETPCPENELIGVQENGEYKQLNANVLQIENEHYSTIRPKQITQWMEKPTLALRRRGVRYVELRSLDVNPFHPLGVSEEQLDFLETFLVFCLLNESPRISATEAKAIDANQILVAHSGREPGLVLNRGGRKVNVRTWGTELLEAMLPVAEMLENETSGGRYCAVLRQQLELLANPELTPSALMLEQMREHREGFFDFASRMSLRHRDYYSGLAQDPERQAFFEREARESLARQEALEQDDRQSFPEFLESYFLQK